jgi:methyltransferase
MVFTIFIAFIIIQRLTELMVAKKNEQWMKSQGALEFGEGQYFFIVLIHSLFFVFYIGEVVYFDKNISPLWPSLLILFLLAQAGRIWALKSLGPYWNTKIIVLPNANIVKKGPYRYIKHPNYLIVATEFMIIPLMFQAYFTAVLFTILNAIILRIRIPAEENALMQLTAYEEAFPQISSLAKILKKV